MPPDAYCAGRQPQSIADGLGVQAVCERQLQDLAVGLTKMPQRLARLFSTLLRDELAQRIWFGRLIGHASAQDPKGLRLASRASEMLLANMTGGLKEEAGKSVRVGDLALIERLHCAAQRFLGDILCQAVVPNTTEGKQLQARRETVREVGGERLVDVRPCRAVHQEHNWRSVTRATGECIGATRPPQLSLPVLAAPSPVSRALGQGRHVETSGNGLGRSGTLSPTQGGLVFKPSTRHLTLTVLLTGLAIEGTVSATSWLIQTVDLGTGGPGGVGFYNSFAYDPGNGQPTIVYADDDRDDVKFARLTASGWSLQVVDAGKNVGTGVDLAYDWSNRPAISYGWGALKFAEWSGTRWLIQTVDSKNARNDETSLVYHNGEPWIAYKVVSGKSSTLKLARRIGSVWTTTVIDTAGAGKWNALAFDASGNPAVAYSADPDGDNTLSSLRLARLVGGQWQIQELQAAVGAGVYADVAFDPMTGNPVVVHRPSSGPIQYLAQTPGGWVTETLDAGVSPALTINPSGLPVVSYSSGTTPGQLKLARRDGGVEMPWTTEVVASEATAGITGFTSLQFAVGASWPAISYCMVTSGSGNTRILKLARPGS